MGNKTVLIVISQATRDALSHLLLAKYLSSKGVKAYLCNQGTFLAMCERHRPAVVFVEWLGDPPMMSYLSRIQHRTHIVAMDQEGGRLRKEVVSRVFEMLDGAKRKLASVCSRLFVWGPLQAQWLLELNVARKEQIVVTGSARFDPYMVLAEKRPALADKYIGVTLRADIITASPSKFMEHVYEYRAPDPVYGIAAGYPLRAQFEDRLWHVAASTRYLFKLAEEAAKRTRARLVFRPGPFEQHGLYDFLATSLPNASVAPNMMQQDYVRGAFVTLDDASNLGLEALLVGTPVISIQALIPRLEEHIGGDDAGLFNAPYTRYYWKPKSLDDAVDLVAKAQLEELPLTPDPDGLKKYLKDAYNWPRRRPSSFVMGDAILELLDMPVDRSSKSETTSLGWRRTLKNAAYRHVPGVVSLMMIKMLAWCAFSKNRQSLMRYHYFGWLYPHHRVVRDLFLRLQESDAAGGKKGGREHEPGN